MYMLQGVALSSKVISRLHIPSSLLKWDLREAGMAQYTADGSSIYNVTCTAC